MAKNLFSSAPGLISEALHGLISHIPASLEPPALVPATRAHELAKTAAMKSAATSGTFTLPPGPLGLVTVIPDLLAVWRIQQQLVADIAAAYGKSDALTRETMAICLFKHGGAALLGRLISRAGDDVIIQRIANRTLQQLLEKIAIRVAQRLAAKSVSRWIPILGAVGAGAYAYYDTSHVAANAIELFSKQLRLATAPEPDVAAALGGTEPKPAKSQPKRKTAGASRGSASGRGKTGAKKSAAGSSAARKPRASHRRRDS